MMRYDVAVVRTGANTFALQTGACPEPRRDEVVLAMQRAAICGTDRQIARGDRPDRARILGHEGIATVVRAGSSTSAWPIGARYAFLPVNPDDQDEILGHSTDGLFRRYVTIAGAEIRRRGLLAAVPEDLPTERAVLAEPVATVVYTHELLAMSPAPSAAQSLLVIGSGSMAILHAWFAREVAGIPDVAIVVPRAERAAWLRARGLLPAGVRIFDGDGTAVRAAPPFAIVVCCVPARAAPAALQLASDAMAPRGALALVGGVNGPSPALPGVDLAAVRRANACGIATGRPMTAAATASGKPVFVFGHRGCAARHVNAAFSTLRTLPQLARILTHRIPLQALPEVLPKLAQGSTLLGTEYVKGLVDCTAVDDAVTVLATEAP